MEFPVSTNASLIRCFRRDFDVLDGINVLNQNPLSTLFEAEKKNDGFEPLFALCSDCFSYANIGGEKIR